MSSKLDAILKHAKAKQEQRKSELDFLKRITGKTTKAIEQEQLERDRAHG